MGERWAEIPGWEGFYAVSDAGRVKSLARSVPGRPGVLINRRERLLRPSVTSDGYLVVSLSRGGRKQEERVHRPVLLAFVGPCPDGMEACHNDDNKADNRLGNLRWDTRSANTADKVRNGRHPMASKTHCKAGHAFTPENTYYPPKGRARHCRACRTEAKRRTNARLVSMRSAA